MRHYLFFLFALLLSNVFGQRKIVTTQIHTSDIAVFQRFFQTPFSKDLSDISNPTPVIAPYYISFQHTSTGKWESKKKFYSIGTSSFSFMIPKKIKVHDSIKSYLTGVSGQLPGFGIDLLCGLKKADLLLLSTIEGGWVWLYGDQRILSRNAFLMPKVTIMPRFSIKKFAISCFAEYGYDVTSKRWKPTLLGPKHGLSVNSFRQSSLTVGLSIGYNYSK